MDISSATSTYDFTVPDFGTPKFALIWTGASNPGSSLRYSSFGFMSFGWWCANGQGSVGVRTASNVSTTLLGRNTSATRALAVPNLTGTGLDLDYTASAITDGIRLTKNTHTLGTSKICQVMLFGGSDILNVDTWGQDVNGSTSITGLSDGGAFTPNWCLFGTVGDGAVGPSTNARPCIGFAVKNYNGAATGTLKSQCLSYMSANGATTSVSSTNLSSHAIEEYDPTAGAGAGYMDVTSFSSGAINYTEAWSSANYAIGLAVEFTTSNTDFFQDRLANIAIDEAGTDVLSYASLVADADNFVGPGLMFCSAQDTQGTAQTSGTFNAAWSIMAWDTAGNMGGFSFSDQDGVSTTDTGGHVNDYTYLQMNPPGFSGAGTLFEGYMTSQVQGFEFKYVTGKDPTSLSQTGLKVKMTMLCFGSGIREMYKGDVMITPRRGTGSGSTSYPMQVYKGSTKVWGDYDY